MMGLITRIRRLTLGRIESFLNTVEDPEVVFPQLIREMEQQVRAATDAEAKAKAAVKSAERAAGEVGDKIARMGKGAEAALRKNDEATAREALQAQVALESRSAEKEKALAAARSTYEEARAAREAIEKQLAELRSRKDEILTRARTAKARSRIEKTVRGPAQSGESILDAVARLESRVDEQEAELDVRRDMDTGGTAPSLEKRVEAMETESEIDKRLADLKERVKADSSH
jgi:phage shock protein A